jgi:hypothetical protein
MSTTRDLERRLADFYATEAAERAPDWVLESALATIDITTQRRVLIRVPWRFNDMNSFAKLVIAAVVVVAIGAIGLSAFRPGSNQVGGPPSPPSPSPVASPSASPSPSTGPSFPALTETFTSDMHGVSVSYPSGWTVTRATEPWTSETPMAGMGPSHDYLVQRETDSAFLSLGSQPLGGQDGPDWAAQVLADPGFEATCPPETEPITIDGAPGMIATICPERLLTALAWTEDRGYLFVLYRIDDVAWFKQILATVDLDPGSARDTVPSASP